MIIGIDDLKTFKVFFDVVYEDCDIVELQTTEENITVSLLDKSHTCFYQVVYDASFFDLYDVPRTETVLLFIDDLVKILKNTFKDDYLTLDVQGDFVTAVFEHSGSRRVFELVQAADFESSPNPPEIDSTCRCELVMDNLNQALKDLDTVRSGSIYFKTEDLNLHCSSETDASMRYDHEINCFVDGEGNAHYNADNVRKIMKFKTINNMLSLKFGDGLPLQWEVSGGGVTATGLIAPYIMEE